MPKLAITGASGGGKSTLVAALAAQGHHTVAEVGRQLVADELEAKGSALPWEDREAFARLLFERSISAFDQAPADGWVFFDRSFIEAIAYCAVIGMAVPERWGEQAAARRFDTPVLVCPPWAEIFTRDSERRHDFEQACLDHAANVTAYEAAGYELIEIPRAPLADRVAFVLDTLATLNGRQPSNPREKR
ncbi:MAG: AAA family ATPase [Hoeflea sp.]|uniref:AAA family ATPase n=1 Tax=Hoeflea sp. TaxID=1940281 RepID=UPI0032EDB0B1